MAACNQVCLCKNEAKYIYLYSIQSGSVWTSNKAFSVDCNNKYNYLEEIYYTDCDSKTSLRNVLTFP